MDSRKVNERKGGAYGSRGRVRTVKSRFLGGFSISFISLLRSIFDI